MKYILIISRLIAGAVFIFSGLVKGIDPLGSMYKFVDYFTAFGLDSLNSLAFVAGIGLAATEFVIGFCLVTGLRYRMAAWGMLILMGIFTPLTLLLALTNPVSDCGCFGDAVKMTNWQTFFKNIILLAFALYLFIYRKKVSSSLPRSSEWAVIGLVASIFIIFSLYNYRHLPVIDFRPYRIGSNIIDGISIPEGQTPDIYETKLIYEKDGKREKFSLENYPSDDTSWVFIDQESVLVKKGYEPPIHDFILTGQEGDDLTWPILQNPGISLFMISRQIDDADPDLFSRGLEASGICTQEGIDFYIITSSSGEKTASLSSQFNILFGDETMLKTMIRANPGFLVLQDGTITAKWAGRDLPSNDNLVNEIINSTRNPGYRSNMRLGLLMAFTLISSLVIAYLLRNKIQTKK